MPRSSIVRLFTAHLGLDSHGAGLVAARSFRSISVTYHRVRSTPWEWTGLASPHAHAVVLFTAENNPASSSDAPDDAAQTALFLPPDAARTVEWEPNTEVLAVWVPHLTLHEFTEGVMPHATALYSSPLTVGFRTFAHSLVRHADEGSPMSHYAVERLLAEMTFGVLLEQQSVDSFQRPSSLIERARSIMLVRREDPGFSTTQLALELHISPRQLQRAFARSGTTPGDMLRRIRVELAESMLRNPLYSGLTVDELARYSGFSTALQLRRALHAEGSPSPTELRRLTATTSTV